MYCSRVTHPFEDAIRRDELSAPPTVDLQSVAQVRSQELQQEDRETAQGQGTTYMCYQSHTESQIITRTTKVLLIKVWNFF